MAGDAVPPELQQFGELLAASISRGDLDRLVLANHRGAPADLQRVTGRLVVLKGRSQLSLLYRHKTRDVTKNFDADAAVAEVSALIDAGSGQGFAHASLHWADTTVDLRFSKKGRASLTRHRQADAAPAANDDAPGEAAGGGAHDRVKRRPLSLAAPYWHDLGITDAEGRLVPALSRKWKQINRFVEVLDAAWRESPLAQRRRGDAAVRVMDFGAGKGYLSFAVAAHLEQTLDVDAAVTGVELRADLVELCNASIRRHGVPGLAFEQGDVVHYQLDALDIMIALHACDTATDHAIHKGIAAGAQIILCSPCCHKELRPQMQTPGLLRPMLQHGIHLGQQAEMITDSLRALMLEAHGYRTQVFEFVSLEHTSKNKMILAVRRDTPTPSGEVFEQIRQIKDFYGVREFCLERLLTAGAAANPAR
ncbi:class I SAM-dependent methyltransferase [Piscinibacter sakaiensis]|uniref:class I SAM-dependent methyltransferase n=1 Tax=Piscinibacter sakaiensis TaxID=1547922 RepID=UPI003AAFB40F